MGGKYSLDIWKMVPLSLMWTIWRERNRHTFKDEKHTGNKLLVFFLVPYLVGLKAWGFMKRDSIVVFLDTLPFVDNFFISCNSLGSSCSFYMK